MGTSNKGVFMKVQRNTSYTLIVEHNPILLSVILTAFGLIFMALGLFTFQLAWWFGSIFLIVGLGIAIGFNMIFTRRTRVTFDRPTATVKLRCNILTAPLSKPVTRRTGLSPARR